MPVNYATPSADQLFPVAGVLAVSKIASDEEARALRANLATFKDKAAGFEFLFADLGQFLHKAADDFGALLTARIETHKAAELVRENQRRELSSISAWPPPA